MKRFLVLLTIVGTALMLLPEDSSAQRKAPPRRSNTTRPAANASAPVTPVPQEPVVTQAPVDTAAINDSLLKASMVPTATISMRPTTTVSGSDAELGNKVPLAYDNIRLEDQVYKQLIWRDISVFEKMNSVFRYEAEDNDGSQSFFYILLKHVRDGDITAFDGINDRFTTPMKIADISKVMTGGEFTTQVPDMVADPDGTKGLFRDTTLYEEFNINTVVGYRIKEEIIFDRETSRLHFRTLGLAPLKEKEFAGQKVKIPMFWVYYPDARPYLARHEAYNPKNMAMRMSWEEVFESRYYASNIYKSTINNPGDKPLSYTVKDPMLRLFEGEKIKEQIFNWEQDQWSY